MKKVFKITLKITKIIFKIIRAGGLVFLFDIMFIKGGIYGITTHLFNKNFINIYTAFIFAILVSGLARYFIIKFYDYIKIDYFGIEGLKSPKEIKRETRATKIIKFLSKLGKYGIYILMFIDPVLMIILFRPGYYKWNGMGNRRGLIIFVLSNIFCSIIAMGIALGIINII